MEIKVKCEPFSHRNERSHHLHRHCHCFFWRNRNRNKKQSQKNNFIYYRDMFCLHCYFQLCAHSHFILFVWWWCFYLFCASATALAILYPQSPNIHPHFQKNRMYTRLISNGEQTLSKNYFYFIFYSSSTPPSHYQFHPFSAFPSLLFLSNIQLEKIPQTRYMKRKEKKSYFNALQQ